MTKRASKWGAALRHLLLGSPMMMLIAVLIVVALVILGTKAARWMVQNNHLDVATTQEVTLSPTQIRSVERIRQWEFLSVSDEELIDTVRHGFFGDDQLIRIYYGTLRLGVDLAETKEGWLRLEGATGVALLPAIGALKVAFSSGQGHPPPRKRLDTKHGRGLKKLSENRNSILSYTLFHIKTLPLHVHTVT